MKTNQPATKRSSHESLELRKQAEAQHEMRFALNHNSDNIAIPKTDVEIQRLIQELQVHQVELEMQNEALRQAHADVESGLERYTDLYDFAPVGYFTLTNDGTIQQVNLNGAFLLGIERSYLIGMRFGQFVADNDRKAFSDFLLQVFTKTQSTSPIPINCDLTLCTQEIVSLSQDHLAPPVDSSRRPFDNTSQCHIHIKATADTNGQTCRAVVVDITERKQMAEELKRLNAHLYKT